MSKAGSMVGLAGLPGAPDMIGFSDDVEKAMGRGMAVGAGPVINPTIPLPPPPTAANTKAQIVAWLQLAGVAFSTAALMALDVSELLDMVAAIVDGP